MKKVKKVILVLLTSILMVIVLNICVYASGSSFQLPSIFDNKYKVYNGGDSYFPDTSSYPYNTNATSIGFDSLYGSGKDFIIYLGEVPYTLKDDETMSKFRMFNGTEIDGQTRSWSETSGVTADEVVVTSKDPHIYAMTVPHPLVDWGFVGLAIVNGLNWLFTKLINLMILIKGLDVSSMLGSIDPTGIFVKQLSSIFLVDLETGAISPFLLFSLLAFIIGLVLIAFKMLKGSESIRNIAKELGFFILAACITGLFFTTANVTKIGSIGIDFLSKLSVNVATSISDSTAVYTYSTDNIASDTSATQCAIVNKTYIDQLINAQFRYQVDDLYLVKPDGSEGGFGSTSDINTAMAETISNGTIDSFSICVDTSGTRKINNLGYFLWAANSSVDTSNLSSSTMSPVFSYSGGKTVVKTASSDRVLLVIDFLSNLREIEETNGNDAMVNKIDTITDGLTNPDYGTAIVNILVILVQNIVLSISLAVIIMFSFTAEVIIVLGSFCMIILPALLLFDKTRGVAQKMTYTYLLSFLRFLIGSSLFNALLVIVTLLSQHGLVGIVMSIIVCLILIKFGPNLMKEINLRLASATRGKELNFMSDMYSGMNNSFDKVGRIGPDHRARKAADKATKKAKAEEERVKEAATGMEKGSETRNSGPVYTEEELREKEKACNERNEQDNNKQDNKKQDNKADNEKDDSEQKKPENKNNKKEDTDKKPTNANNDNKTNDRKDNSAKPDNNKADNEKEDDGKTNDGGDKDDNMDWFRKSEFYQKHKTEPVEESRQYNNNNNNNDDNKTSPSKGERKIVDEEDNEEYPIDEEVNAGLSGVVVDDEESPDDSVNSEEKDNKFDIPDADIAHDKKEEKVLITRDLLGDDEDEISTGINK